MALRNPFFREHDTGWCVIEHTLRNIAFDIVSNSFKDLFILIF